MSLPAEMAVASQKALDRFRDGGVRTPSDASATLQPPGRLTLAEILERVEQFLRRYVVFASNAQAGAIALWVAHTHAIQAAEHTPYLHVSSPEKQSGKTRVLETLELIVAKPWRVVEVSESALFRTVEAERPTLLLDEVDAIFARDAKHFQGLRAIINAGHRRGAYVPRVEGEKKREVKKFDTFCAKVLSGIGLLPDTIADRCIPIRLQRKARNETAQRFRYREAKAHADPIRQALEVWASPETIRELSQARPELPEDLSDRAADGWEALLAIADLAGEGSRAREVAVELQNGSDSQDDTTGILLLRHLRDVFTESERNHLSSREALVYLCDREDGPWPDWWGKAVAANETRGPASRMARILKPFGIGPKTIREGESVFKGYSLADFAEAWERYIREQSPVTSLFPPQTGNEVTEQVTGQIAYPIESIETKPKTSPEQGSSVVTSSGLEQEGELG